MKNEKLEDFLYKNRLKSSDLVEFWGVSKGVVSQILNGTTKLPTKRLELLLNNDRGWDVSMLTEEPQPQLVNENGPSLTGIEALLRDMLAEERARVEALNEMIWELKAENARLQEQLRIKGGAAADAEDSLSATA